jgi:hypothetical protein
MLLLEVVFKPFSFDYVHAPFALKEIIKQIYFFHAALLVVLFQNSNKK